MPELPDVENFKRYLDATALSQRIAKIHVGSAKILHGVTAAVLARRLTGRSLVATRRHGKHLLARLDGAGWLTLHFGMTGRLAYFAALADDPPYDRLRLDFANGRHLAYVNLRLLGRVGWAADANAFIRAEGLGPDALDEALTERAFVERLAGRKGAVKAALMDQSLLAGIGNIYADEILFQARLDPRTALSAFDSARLKRLYKAMRRVLQTAVARGAGSEALFERLPRGYLLRDRRAGASCPRCGGAIATLKVSGRTSYYCPACQTG